MKLLLAAIAVGSTMAFAPLVSFGVSPRSSFTCLDAKHVQDKAARWARAKRPKKHRKSDIFRAPTNYPVIVKPEEYTIVMAEGEDAALSAVIIPSNRGSRNAVLKRLTRKEKEAQGN